MHHHGARGLILFELVFAVALIWNCERGLSQREDMYNRQSTLYTTGALLLGIVLGIALLLHALWLLQLVYGWLWD